MGLGEVMESRTISEKVVDLPFSPRSCDCLCKLPEFAFRDDALGFFVSVRRPVRGQADCGRELGIFGLGDENYTFFFEDLKCIFKGFFVYGFEI